MLLHVPVSTRCVSSYRQLDLVCADSSWVACRLFKLPGKLETPCEDYGQVATYLGTLPGHKHSYALDDHHNFVTNKPMLVCGSTAAMVGDSWLGRHFKVVGDTSVHYGLFDCGSAPVEAQAGGDAASGGCC